MYSTKVDVMFPVAFAFHFRLQKHMYRGFPIKYSKNKTTLNFSQPYKYYVLINFIILDLPCRLMDLKKGTELCTFLPFFIGIINIILYDTAYKKFTSHMMACITARYSK